MENVPHKEQTIFLKNHPDFLSKFLKVMIQFRIKSSTDKVTLSKVFSHAPTKFVPTGVSSFGGFKNESTVSLYVGSYCQQNCKAPQPTLTINADWKKTMKEER